MFRGWAIRPGTTSKAKVPGTSEQDLSNEFIRDHESKTVSFDLTETLLPANVRGADAEVAAIDGIDNVQNVYVGLAG